MNYDYSKAVKDFDSLYKLVTENITEYTGNKNNNLSSGDKVWITALVNGFKTKYEKWEFDEKDYLCKATASGGRLFRLSACAFLHIAKDLPVVIEQNLDKQMSGEEIFRHKTIYNHLEAPLEKSLSGDWDKPFKVSVLFWKGWHTEQIFLHWMFNLRQRAWDYALWLLYAPNISQAIDDLGKKVTGAMLEAQKKTWFWDRVLSLRLGFFSAIAASIAMIVLFNFHILLDIVSIIAFFEGGDRLDSLFEKKIQQEFFTEFYFQLDKEEIIEEGKEMELIENV
jgi:hypothetical protein